MPPVFLLTTAYFVLGGLALGATPRRSDPAASDSRWTKFAVYFVVVHAVILAILAGPRWFAALATVLVALGLLEILRVGTSARRPWRWPLVVTLGLFVPVAVGFLHFATDVTTSRALFVYVVVLTFDGFSQVTGQLIGRRRLAPRISPGKTLAGLGGGLLAATLTAMPLSGMTGTSTGPAIGLAVGVAVVALCGDLAASAAKRAFQVKDYGRLLPGHGGVLDRFDSFLAAGAAYWWIAGR